MRSKFLALFFLGFFCVTLLFELSITSCASISSPSGGERDTIPPSLDTSFPPNLSLNFKAKEISIFFSEYLNLKNPNQQIVISPPIAEKLEVNLRGKEILIGIPSELQPNTTYTISFGSSITDFTEGNVNTDFKYIFSTGSFIDSLMIRGYIRDSYSDTPDEKMLVALYEYQDTIRNMDSLPFQKIPSYYSYTDEKGYFEMSYLKESSFMVIAFEDPQSDFTLNTGTEKIAFLSDTLQTLEQDKEILKLYSFEPKPTYKFFGARHKQQGLITFSFSKSVPNVSIENLDSIEPLKLERNEIGDTIYYWLNDADLDSARFVVKNGEMLDTAEIFIREFDVSKLKLSPLKAQISFKDTIRIRTSLPLKDVDSSKFILLSEEDTIQPEFVQDTSGYISILPKIKGKELTLIINKDAATSIFDSQNDSTGFSFSKLSKQDLGNLKFDVIADSNRYVLEIYDTKENKLLKNVFSDSTTVDIRNFLPGEYKAVLIADTDGNKEWSTGNFFKKTEAEKVYYFDSELEIRANWDLELRWEMNLKP